MPFDPVREAAGSGSGGHNNHNNDSNGRSSSPSTPLFTPIAPIPPIPPSPSIKKGSLANILNDDPSLDPNLRSPEARMSSSSYIDSTSPVFEFPPRSSSSSFSHPFFPSPSMAPTLTQTASSPASASHSHPPSRQSSEHHPHPQPNTFSLSSPPPPRQQQQQHPSSSLYRPTKSHPNTRALLPLTNRDLDTFARSRNWLRKDVDRASLGPPVPVQLPPLASVTSLRQPTKPSLSVASPEGPTTFSDAEGIGYYLPPSSRQELPAERPDSGRYPPSGLTTGGGYSPSRPTSAKRPREEENMPLPDGKRRMATSTAAGDDISAVAGHYNARPEVGRIARKDSPIIALKNFNNWVKSVLIQKYGRSGSGRSAQVRVLDMGCGKGGDLLKWSRNGISEYIGLDVAEVSVRQAEERFLEMRQTRMRAAFWAVDCYRVPIRAAVPPEVFRTPFQTVTMQFCMHYAFYSEQSVRQMLENVSTNLEKGGTFIGTIPNAEHILANLHASNSLSFGNPVFRITFPEPPPDPPNPSDRDQSGAFGHKYFFFLQDAVGQDEDGVPEYLVHWPNFARLASEYGLVEEYKKDFADLLNEERDHEIYGPLLRRMKVVDADGQSDMDEEQWEAASIYLAFAFRKR